MVFLSFPIFTLEFLFFFSPCYLRYVWKISVVSNCLQGDWSPSFWIFARFGSKRWIDSWICRSCRTGKLRCPRKVGTLTLVFVRKGVFEDVNCAIALKVMIHYHKWTSLLVWICQILCFKFTYVQVRIQHKNGELLFLILSFLRENLISPSRDPPVVFLQELHPSMDDGLGCFGLAFHGQCTCPCWEVGGRLVLCEDRNGLRV